jgi:hypothetical protein
MASIEDGEDTATGNNSPSPPHKAFMWPKDPEELIVEEKLRRRSKKP